MVRLSRDQRNLAIGNLQAGIPVQQVARSFGVHRTTIARLWNRFQQTGSGADLPRTGRPRVTTAAQDRFIVRQHTQNPFQTATETAMNLPAGNQVTSQTVRNRLRNVGLRCRRPLVGVVLTPLHRAARLQWSRIHGNWPRQRWLNVLFTDESRFLMNRADGRQRVYRRVNQRYQPNCIRQVDRFGGGGVMVWAGITSTGRTNLYRINGNLTGQRCHNEIWQQFVVPYIQANGGILQHDNARPHVARVCTQYLQAQGIQVLPWPSRSPDLNPIEHAWDELDRRLRHRQPQPQNLNALFQALDAEWQAIPQHVFNNLVSSMGRRCRAVVQANGGHTRY